MPTNKKTQYTMLQDALLNMSEQDSKESMALLRETGADAVSLVNHSLAKVEQHRARFEKRLENTPQTDLLANVQAKIQRLLVAAPERTSNFLNSYFSQRSLKVQFGANAGFDQKKLEKVKEKIDLNDLSNQLDNEELSSESVD